MLEASTNKKNVDIKFEIEQALSKKQRHIYNSISHVGVGRGIDAVKTAFGKKRQQHDAHCNFAYIMPKISAPTHVHHGEPILFKGEKKSYRTILAINITVEGSVTAWCTC